MSRSPDRIQQIASPSDSSVLALCAKALEDGIVDEVRVADGPFGTITLSSAEEVGSIAGDVPSADLRSISNVSFRCLGHQICVLSRVRTIFTNGSYNHEPSRLVAELLYDQAEQRAQQPETQAELKSRQKDLWRLSAEMLGAGVYAAKEDGSTISEILSAHVQSLAGEAANIASRLAAAEIENERRTQAHLTSLSQQAIAAEQLRQESHDRRINELKEREAALEAKAALLDTRSSRDARRKIREELTSTLKTRLAKPEASSSARMNRYFVVGVSLMIIVVAIISAIFSVPGISRLSNSSGVLESSLAYGRFFGSTAAVVVFGFYLLGYLRKLEAEDTRYERDLERFSLDIDRASWVIETIMDFDSEGKDRTIPDKWLNNATASLFGSSQQVSDEDDNALEALGKLLGTGAKLRVGPDGAEITLEPKAAKKVAKSAD